MTADIDHTTPRMEPTVAEVAAAIKETQELWDQLGCKDLHLVESPELELCADMIRISKEELDKASQFFLTFLEQFTIAQGIVRWLENTHSKLTFYHVCERMNQEPSCLRAQLLASVPPALRGILTKVPNVRCFACGRIGVE